MKRYSFLSIIVITLLVSVLLANEALVSFAATGADAKPTVITNDATIKGNTVTLNGEVTRDGGHMVDEVYFKYGEDANHLDKKIPLKVLGNTGKYKYRCILSGLDIGKLYYYRLYAHNYRGTTEGDLEPFTIDSPYRAYVLYAPGLSSLAKTAKKNISSMYGIDEAYIDKNSFNTTEELKIFWDNIDDRNYKISCVVIIAHSNWYSFGKSSNAFVNASDITSFNDKTIGTTYIIGCNSGHLIAPKNNIAAQFAQKTNSQPVIASDGTINYNVNTDSEGYLILNSKADSIFRANATDGRTANIGWLGYVYLNEELYLSQSLGRKVTFFELMENRNMAKWKTTKVRLNEFGFTTPNPQPTVTPTSQPTDIPVPEPTDGLDVEQTIVDFDFTDIIYTPTPTPTSIPEPEYIEPDSYAQRAIDINQVKASILNAGIIGSGTSREWYFNVKNVGTYYWDGDGPVYVYYKVYINGEMLRQFGYVLDIQPNEVHKFSWDFLNEEGDTNFNIKVKVYASYDDLENGTKVTEYTN